MGGSKHLTAAALAAAITWGWAGGAAAVEIATVAKTGDPAPGTGGATFTSVGISVVNGAGEVAFRGILSGGDQGIWQSGPAGLALVAKEGEEAPGAGSATFTEFSFLVLNGAGEVVFRGTLSDGGQGIWLSGPAGLALVAKTGDAAPGAGSATFADVFFPVLNGAGQVAFSAGLSGGGQGIWQGGPAGLALLARSGDEAPGADGATFTDNFFNLFLNGAGEVVFQAALSDGGDGIWQSGPSGLLLVAKTGDEAPGVGGATFATLNFSGPVLNGAGQVAFRGFLSDGGNGIWLGRPSGLALVARDGDAAPGFGGQTFSFLGFPSLNGAGELAFQGFLGDCCDDQGIWLGGPGGYALVAKTGDEAPGAGGLTFKGFDNFVLNGPGDVAIIGNLGDASTEPGIWAGSPDDLQLIVREGDVIEVAPGDFRTVDTSNLPLGFFGISGNESGRASGFSEGGQLAFFAQFTDLSRGIFLSPPGAPTVYPLPKRAVDGAWDQVMLPRSFEKPVIIAGPPGFANRKPGAVRLREIEGAEGRFEARFQEWRYLDGKHPEERTDFLALEKGRQRQADGSLWEAGSVKVKGNRVWKKKRFKRRFRRPPEVFVTVQSFKGETPVAARVRNVTRKGFEVSIQEEERDLVGGHPKETVGYLAVFGLGRGTIAGGVDGTDYRLRRTKVNQRFKTVLGEELKLEEEKSSDKERKHEKEAVSVMTLGRGFFAQQASDREPDTTAPRRR